MEGGGGTFSRYFQFVRGRRYFNVTDSPGTEFQRSAKREENKPNSAVFAARTECLGGRGNISFVGRLSPPPPPSPLSHPRWYVRGNIRRRTRAVILMADVFHSCTRNGKINVPSGETFVVFVAYTFVRYVAAVRSYAVASVLSTERS